MSMGIFDAKSRAIELARGSTRDLPTSVPCDKGHGHDAEGRCSGQAAWRLPLAMGWLPCLPGFSAGELGWMNFLESWVRVGLDESTRKICLIIFF